MPPPAPLPLSLPTLTLTLQASGQVEMHCAHLPAHSRVLALAVVAQMLATSQAEVTAQLAQAVQQELPQVTVPVWGVGGA